MMDSAGQDTDTLLATLLSLLAEPAPDHDTLLDALVRADGDVHRAVEVISSDKTIVAHTRGRKRKGLESWLQKESPVKARARVQSPEKEKASPRLPAASSRKPSSSTSTSSRSNSPSKPSINAFDLLKPKPSTKPPSVAKLPPLTLSNPRMVAEHTPCSLHPSILPPELACDLFYTMLQEARDWGRNKWYMFDRLVESPHRTAFYTRNSDGESEENRALHQVAQSWYNGRKQSDGPPRSFPKSVERACQIVEDVVNQEMLKRTRFPLEWGGVHPDGGGDKIVWRANFCASNMYEGAKETVGYHSDRLTAIGPYATIASISLGSQRTFRLREVVPVDEREQRAPRTFNIPLPHNSLLIMHGSTQERFKHTIPPQTTLDRFHPPFPPPASLPESPFDPTICRVNITFRFYRPDFHPESVPRCMCDEPATLRPDMKKLQRDDGRGAGPEEQRGEGEFRYWWACTAGDQNEGKQCKFWKVMDARAEGRGPFVMDEPSS